jgi:DNA replication protein DnaC
MENGVPVVFVESIDLPDENIKDMIYAPVLVIDDLGNDKMQSSKEAIVLKVIRHRANWRRPTIITTQFVGSSLEERFSDLHTARAVIRRLRDYCDDVAA